MPEWEGATNSDLVEYVLELKAAIGRCNADNELKGDRQERYGSGIVDDLARRLTDQYGRGFDRRNLYRFVKFYQTYGNIVTSVSAQFLDASCQFIPASIANRKDCGY